MITFNATNTLLYKENLMNMNSMRMLDFVFLHQLYLN